MDGNAAADSRSGGGSGGGGTAAGAGAALSESEARRGLQVVELASQGRPDDVRTLVGAGTVPAGVALEMLLAHLPETAAPASYGPVVWDIVHGTAGDGAAVPAVPAAIGRLDAAAAARALAALADAPDSAAVPFAAAAGDGEDEPAATLAAWILARADRINTRVGGLAVVTALVADETWPGALPVRVRAWRAGVLQPLVRFVDKYPARFDGALCSLRAFERAEPADVLAYVLADTSAATIVADVATVCQPYVEYQSARARSATAAWATFFAWTVAAAGRDFAAVAELFRAWPGPYGPPELVRLYVSAMVGSCYTCAATTPEAFEAMHALQKKCVAVLSADAFAGDEPSSPTERETVFAYPDSPLFAATGPALGLLDKIITSAAMISIYVPTRMHDVAVLRLFGSQSSQLQFLSKIVRGTAKEYAYRDDSNWRTLRSGARWLQAKSFVLGKLSQADIENTFLSALLEFGRIALVREIYIDPVVPPLALDDIAGHILAAFERHFDGASNCSASRGSLRTAAQVLHLVYPGLLTSEPLDRAEALLRATNKIGSYALTLVHGQPLSPLQLKMNGNAEDVVEQILAANPRAYAELDDLVATARDFCTGLAVVPETGLDYRVTRMCVYSALVADDFSAAYDYCINRLWPDAETIQRVDPDLLWQVFFAAGKFVSPNSPAALPVLSPGAPDVPVFQLRHTIDHLGLQLKLLSYAMNICPERSIFEILTVWQDFELQRVQYLRRYQHQKAQQKEEQTSTNAASVVKNFLRMF
ncbi:Sec39 domain-containing protein [Dipodascopsis tothii]|uniref:Sec39 domain-containing protein n=1 Tax=Dipodascopsis tothii TaxID=44089 RepID=UPI0034CE5F4C